MVIVCVIESGSILLITVKSVWGNPHACVSLSLKPVFGEADSYSWSDDTWGSDSIRINNYIILMLVYIIYYFMQILVFLLDLKLLHLQVLRHKLLQLVDQY